MKITVKDGMGREKCPYIIDPARKNYPLMGEDNLLRAKEGWETSHPPLPAYDQQCNVLADGWIRVEDRLPEDGQRVLCAQGETVLWDSFEFWINPNNKHSHEFINQNYSFGIKSITHWRPLLKRLIH